jgi:ribonuclease R
MRVRLLEYMRQDAYKPLAVNDIASELDLEAADIRRLQDLLDEMEDAGEVVRTRVGKYGVPERLNLMVGRLQAHNKGFGFVLATAPGAADVFVSADGLNGAMHNDKVMVRINTGSVEGRRREGEIVRILERATNEIVGTFENRKTYGLVVPDDPRVGYDIFIARKYFSDAKQDQKVVAKITSWPEKKRRSMEGKITEVLGDRQKPGVDILSIIKKQGLPLEFPQPVLREAEAVTADISL